MKELNVKVGDKLLYSYGYSYNRAERIDNAVTLCARDYKGLNNFGTNGVIEWKE